MAEINSEIRAKNIFANAVKNGYKKTKYRVIGNEVFLKNEIDKKILFKCFYDLFVTRDFNSVLSNLTIFL